MQTGHKSAGVKILTDCSRLPVPILDINHSSKTLRLSFRKISFRALYSDGFNTTRTLPAQRFDIFFRSGDFIYTILSFGNTFFFAPHQLIPHFEVTPSVSGGSDHSGDIWEILWIFHGWQVHRSALKQRPQKGLPLREKVPLKGLPAYQAKFLPTGESLFLFSCLFFPCLTWQITFVSCWQSRCELGLGCYQGLLCPTSTRFLLLIGHFDIIFLFFIPLPFSVRRIKVEAFSPPPWTSPALEEHEVVAQAAPVMITGVVLAAAAPVPMLMLLLQTLLLLLLLRLLLLLLFCWLLQCWSLFGRTSCWWGGADDLSPTSSPLHSILWSQMESGQIFLTTASSGVAGLGTASGITGVAGGGALFFLGHIFAKCPVAPQDQQWALWPLMMTSMLQPQQDNMSGMSLKPLWVIVTWRIFFSGLGEDDLQPLLC